MKPWRILVMIILGVALIVACQTGPITPQSQTDTQKPVPAKTKTPTLTSINAAEILVEITSSPTSTDRPKNVGGGVQLSLSSQAMKGAKSFAQEYPGVKEEVYFSGGFGGGGFRICRLSEVSQLPIIGYEDVGFDPTIELCLIGFPKNEPIQIDLYTPEGFLVGTKTLKDPGHDMAIVVGEVNDQLGVYRYFEGETVNGNENVWKDINIQSLQIWTPVGLPQGRWRVIASSENITREVTIPLTNEMGKSYRVSTLPSLVIDPFENRSCAEYRAGDELYIAGSGFQPKRNFPLGIYYSTGAQVQASDGNYGDLFVKVFGTMVSVSNSGDFIFQYPIDENAPDGKFFVNLLLDDDDRIDNFPYSSDNCFEIVTGNGTPTPRADTTHSSSPDCKGAPTTRLKIGDHASIGLVPPDPNTVREKPGRKQTRLGLLQPGETIKILDGPKCADGWIWWKVISLDTGLEGWTAEGDMENYWIVPKE